jgi:hypothetical protein
MSTLELGGQFKDFAKTMVASEGSIPTAGWNYAQILLGRIKNNPKSSAKDIAVSFVDQFIKQQNKFALADISVDISAWDLMILPKLEECFAELVDNLLECFKDKESVAYNQMRRLLVHVHWQCQTYLLEQHIDLGDFCQLLTIEIDLLKNEIAKKDLSSIIKVRESCKMVVESIRECVLLTGFSGSDFQFSNGISLFFPWSLASYKSAKYDYQKLSFIKENGSGKKWNEFLIKYLSEITLRKSNPLTQTDKDGNIISSSVIYESYANMDDPNTTITDISNTSGNTKQPPNSGRQPPNSGRQPPNSGRMLSEMNIFLTRFMRLKNFQSHWNRAGFTSQNVIFKPTSVTNLQRPIQASDDRIVIEIPKPRSIQKSVDNIFFRLNEFGKNNSENVNIEGYTYILKEIVQNSDEPTIVEILGDLSELNSFNSNNPKEEDLTVVLENAFSKSIATISDVKLKEEILKNFDKIRLK